MDTNRNSHTVGGLAVLLVCCVFAASALLALAFGARAYRSVENRTQENYGRRVGLSYIEEKVHAYDGVGLVSVGTFDGLSALYLREAASGEPYHTILYATDGWLYELYCEDGQSFAPEDGEKLLEVGDVAFFLQGNLMCAELTDTRGNHDFAEVCLRSDGGVA